jgi:hypothetical protein
MIINALGQEIAKPYSNKLHNAGNFRFNFETSSLAEGVYFILLQTETESISKLFLILK